MSIPQSQNQETVLLRYPRPRYSFQARKLPSTSSHLDSQTTTKILQSSLPAVLTTRNSSATSLVLDLKGHSSSTAELAKKSATVRPLQSSWESAGAEVSTLLKSPGKEVDQSDWDILTAGSHSHSLETRQLGLPPVTNYNYPAVGLQTTFTTLQTSQGYSPTNKSQQASCTQKKLAVVDGLLSGSFSGSNQLEELETLKGQLEMQLQVNTELKRLLIASVGEDLEYRLENLARDRARLAMDVGDFSKKVTEDYENLDKISIQADMWRSKYLASRVMLEEQASAHAFYSNQYQDCQQALQHILNERYELRATLLQAYKYLLQVKEAFDPLNAQKSESLNESNVLELSRLVKQLSEAVRFRLLPAQAGSHVILPREESWDGSMTKAEIFAYELLSRKAESPSFVRSIPGGFMPLPKFSERFHPQTRHDNLTMYCCPKCQGEIIVV